MILQKNLSSTLLPLQGTSCSLMFRVLLSFILLTFLVAFSGFAQASKIELSSFDDGTLGKYIQYFQEKGNNGVSNRLTFTEAKRVFDTSQSKQGSTNSISLGIGVDPAWMKFSVDNNSDAFKKYRLTIETPWLDYIDTYLMRNGEVVKHIAGGDGFAYEERPMQYRFYGFEYEYEPGIYEIYIRIESKGPMAIPVRFSTMERAIERDISSGYQYGVLYGIMSALALYNLVLFLFIRQREYGLYSLYLAGFVLNSLSYTGQLHVILTPDFGPFFQDWVDIFLMITYSVAGLHFARALLDTKAYAPNLDKFVVKTTIIIPVGMVIGFIIDQLFFSMALAFILNTCFVVLFVAMGVSAIQVKKPFALIFLLSSVTAAICITVSTLAVAGILVPYNDYTFKAIEVGMAFEAILLATILARQFRMAKLDKIIAETYARADALTQLNNRHGFQEVTSPIWQMTVREKRDASIVLIDIDHFKKFNDLYGHETGDKVLSRVANCIADTARKGDITARWGGEEFIIFLPETSLDNAAIQAERIRKAVSELELRIAEVPLSITASFGVAGTENKRFNDEFLELSSLEPLINQADRAMYVAKQSGKNLVYAGN